jgi:hypothetical protein
MIAGTESRGAQTAFILFSTFLDLRPVSAAHDVQTSINSRLEIQISKSKMPVGAALVAQYTFLWLLSKSWW